ncbi:MAG: periplasmic heavy metal sensor [Candidatus Omnitrophica bacterium]|nr:periplasmic heavy metal sensor [Candidatus Omnitrophota bacterium]
MKILQCLLGLVFGMFVMTSYVQAQKIKDETKAISSEVGTKLGLTPEQRDKLAALQERFTAELRVIGDTLKTKRVGLKEALAVVSPDRKKVDSLVGEINQLNSQELTKRIDQAFAVNALLTPQQNQNLQKLLSEQKGALKTKGEGKKAGKAAKAGKGEKKAKGKKKEK